MPKFEPKVTLLNPREVKDFLFETGQFASICTDMHKPDKNREEYEKIGLFCVRAGHWSPARSTFWKFCIEDVSRVMANQTVRHKIGVEFNQESQRYVDADKDDFVVPESIAINVEALKIYTDNAVRSFDTYMRLIELGIPRGDARYALIFGSGTKFNIALTPQAAMHFFTDRLCTRAQKETYRAASMMANQVLDVEPRLSEFIGPKCVAQGKCKEKNPCGKGTQWKSLPPSLCPLSNPLSYKIIPEIPQSAVPQFSLPFPLGEPLFPSLPMEVQDVYNVNECPR
jgi:thymidylate synthase (FAD)